MVEVAVTGIGLVSALGNLTESWQGILEGESAIASAQPYKQLPPLPLGLINSVPANLNDLIPQLVEEVIQTAGLTLPLPDCGVVIGSSRGYQGELERLASLSPFPIPHFPNLLPQRVGIEAARKIGARGPVLAPMAACATGIWSIALACELIETGQCQQAIAGAIETPITPLTLAGFQKMGALAQTGVYPFDRHREGLVLAEGGGLFMLESVESARQRSAPILGKILGYGLTNDACYANAPDLKGKSGLMAIEQCLQRSQLSARDLDYIHAHGTGTKLNDKNEAKLIEKIFPLGVAVSSTKGATGHTLGASGALGLAFSLMALKHQILPPCVGLKEPEFNLDLIKMARKSKVRNALCFSFGFGGQNAVISINN
ncbi:MAG: beta-ketoacyl-ACP synthase [Okeania sp. SIO2H7]|nr:beta-ketoacyl-ACP synthase [Okeania sp. SIO2H7]